MVQLLPTILLAGTASAQVTTSMWLLKSFLGTDKIGYQGSVVGASGTMATLALVYDNGTDKNRFADPRTPVTYTVGPSYFAAEAEFGPGGPTSVNRNARYVCSQPTTAADAKPTCTVSYPPYYARIMACNTGRITATSVQAYTYTHTYSGRGTYSAGVETLTQQITLYPRTTPTASWCSDATYLPPNGTIVSATYEPSSFAMFQVVLTAGLEKLSATSSAATRTPVNVTGAPTPSIPVQSTAAAAPVKTVAPVVAGVGAVLAAFL